jgi:hypothetical protein
MRYTDPREVDEDETVMTGRQEAEMGMQQVSDGSAARFQWDRRPPCRGGTQRHT